MAKTSSSSISIAVAGDGATEAFVPPACPVLNTTAPNSGLVAVALSPGNNTIAVPTGAIGVCIVPSASSTNAKVFKGANADTGIAMRAGVPMLVYFDTITTTQFVINATAGETISLHWL